MPDFYIGRLLYYRRLIPGRVMGLAWILIHQADVGPFPNEHVFDYLALAKAMELAQSYAAVLS